MSAFKEDPAQLLPPVPGYILRYSLEMAIRETGDLNI
jgi:hypothetical protein